MHNGVEMRNFLAFLVALFFLPVSVYAATPDADSNSSDPYGRNHSIGIGVGATFSTTVSGAPHDVPITVDYQYRFASFYSMGAEATVGVNWYGEAPDLKIYWINAFHVYHSERFAVSLQAGFGPTLRYVSEDPVDSEYSSITPERKAGFSMKADIVLEYRVTELLSLKLKADFQDQMAFDVTYWRTYEKHTLHQFESSVQIMTSFHF